MTRVRMLVDISGGRADGTEWPRYGTVLDCGDDEAGRLVAGGHAEPAEDDVQPAVTPVAPVPASEPDAEPPADPPAAVESPDREDGSQDDEEPSDGSKPRVRDAKEIWEQHAITVHGADVNAARSMSKKELIDAYGSG